jgi:hypothetical protein
MDKILDNVNTARCHLDQTLLMNDGNAGVGRREQELKHDLYPRLVIRATSYQRSKSTWKQELKPLNETTCQPGGFMERDSNDV